MRTERLLGILTVLLRREKATAAELAERFEVSVRTIGRDVAALCGAGIPVVTEQGYGGGIRIADGYAVDRSLLTREELGAVLTGLKGVDSVSRTPRTQLLMEKLSQTPARSISADDVIAVDLGSFYADAITAKLEILKRAILNRRHVSFRYYSAAGESRRSVEPYLLTFRWSAWYLYAYCLAKNDYRLFKLNRLWELEEGETVFSPRDKERPKPDFDRYFTENTIRLKAVFESGAKYRLIEEYGPACFRSLADGGLLFEREFAGYENMREWIASFGSGVFVLEPQRLREDLAADAKKIVEMYP